MSLRRPLLGVVLLFAGAHLAACGGSTGKETVAVAGAVAISQAELQHWAAISERTSHRRSADARSHALNYLIVSAWIRAEAERRGVSVAASEVERDVQSRASTFVGGPEAFKAALARSGLTLADARSQTETKLLYSRLEGKIAGSVRTPVAAMVRYYRLHRRRFVIPERRFFLSDSRSSMREAASDRARVLAGAPFPSRAMHESLSRSQIDSRGPRRNRIMRAIFSARPGVPVGPFHNEPVEFYTLVEVTRIVPARYQTFKQVRAQIEHVLTAAAARQALDSFRRTWQMRWRAATHCRELTAASACDPSADTPVALGL